MPDVGVPYPIIPPQAAHERSVTQHGVDYGELSPEQAANVAGADDLEKEQRARIERERLQQAEADKIDRQHKENAAQAMQAIDDEKARRDVDLQKNIGEWQNRLEGAYQKAQSAPPPSLFADQTTGQKALRGFGLLLAGIGDTIAAGANARYGTAKTDSFGQIIEADLQRQREKIAKLKDDEIMARTGVKDAREARSIAMGELDAKGAGFMKRLEAIATTRMASLKEGDQGYVNAMKAQEAAKDGRLKFQQSSLSGLTIRHQGPDVTTVDRQESTMPKPVQPGTEDVNKTVDLDSSIENVKSMIADLKSRPKTWTETRDNDESWMRANASKGVPVMEQGRALAQTLGMADVSAEQGLRGVSPEARAFHQKQERFTVDLGKAAFGVLTEKEKGMAGSIQGNLSLPPKEKIAALETFLKTVEAKRQGYTDNRGVKPASGPPMLVPTPPPAGKTDVPAAPVPITPESPRAAAIRLLKLDHDRKGASAIRKQFNITDEDLR